MDIVFEKYTRFRRSGQDAEHCGPTTNTDERWIRAISASRPRQGSVGNSVLETTDRLRGRLARDELRKIPPQFCLHESETVAMGHPPTPAIPLAAAPARCR